MAPSLRCIRPLPFVGFLQEERRAPREPTLHVNNSRYCAAAAALASWFSCCGRSPGPSVKARRREAAAGVEEAVALRTGHLPSPRAPNPVVPGPLQLPRKRQRGGRRSALQAAAAIFIEGGAEAFPGP